MDPNKLSKRCDDYEGTILKAIGKRPLAPSDFMTVLQHALSLLMLSVCVNIINYIGRSRPPTINYDSSESVLGN